MQSPRSHSGVDDVDINRDIAASFLRKSNYEIVCARRRGSGATCRGTGFQCHTHGCSHAGRRWAGSVSAHTRLGSPRGQVPIVALTAQVLTDQIESCRVAGMDTHLAKPFTMQRLPMASRARSPPRRHVMPTDARGLPKRPARRTRRACTSPFLTRAQCAKPRACWSPARSRSTYAAGPQNDGTSGLIAGAR